MGSGSLLVLTFTQQSNAQDVFSHESALCSDQELFDWLSDQGITEFCRLSTHSDSSQLLVPSFEGTQLLAGSLLDLNCDMSNTTFPPFTVVFSASVMAIGIALVPILLFMPSVD